MSRAAIYSSKTPLTYRELEAAQVPLNASLAKTIHSYHKKFRESLFHLCVIAYGLRKSNLVKKKSGSGGNQASQEYKPEFWKWYERENLGSAYGSKSNFALYAMSGRLLSYVRWQIDAKKGSSYIDRLPSSLGTLYALSQVLWSQGESATEASRRNFHKLLTEPVRDGSVNNAFICPSLTRREVEDQLAKINGGRGKSAQEMLGNDEADGSSNQLHNGKPVLARILLQPTALEFSKRGTPKGPTLDKLSALENDLKKLVERYGAKHLVLDTNLSAIESMLRDAQNPDFGSELRKGK